MEIELFDRWNELKKEIHDKNTDNIYFKESEIWWTSIWKNIKSESFWKWDSFRRPVLIFKKLSSDICIVIPLSSKNKTWTWFCDCDFQWIRRTALLYQIKMIHKNRFQRKIWELDELDFETIKKKLGKLLNF